MGGIPAFDWKEKVAYDMTICGNFIVQIGVSGISVLANKLEDKKFLEELLFAIQFSNQYNVKISPM